MSLVSCTPHDAMPAAPGEVTETAAVQGQISTPAHIVDEVQSFPVVDFATKMRGELENESDTDVYAFAAIPGKTYLITIEDELHINHAVTVTDEAGKIVAKRYNRWQRNRDHNCFEDFPFLNQMKWQANGHGVHYLRIAPNPYGEPTFGKYSVDIDEYESVDDYPDFAPEATTIEIGLPVKGIIEWGRDADHFRFVAEPRRAYTVNASSISRHGVTLDVVDAENQPLKVGPYRRLFETTDLPDWCLSPNHISSFSCNRVDPNMGEYPRNGNYRGKVTLVFSPIKTEYFVTFEPKPNRRTNPLHTHRRHTRPACRNRRNPRTRLRFPYQRYRRKRTRNRSRCRSFPLPNRRRTAIRNRFQRRWFCKLRSLDSPPRQRKPNLAQQV